MFASYPKIHPIQLATINPNVGPERLSGAAGVLMGAPGSASGCWSAGPGRLPTGNWSWLPGKPKQCANRKYISMFASYPKIHPIQLATINPNVMWVLKGFLEQQVCWELQVLLLDADLLGLEGCQLETEAGWENQPKTMSHSVRIMHSNVFLATKYTPVQLVPINPNVGPGRLSGAGVLGTSSSASGCWSAGPGKVTTWKLKLARNQNNATLFNRKSIY